MQTIKDKSYPSSYLIETWYVRYGKKHPTTYKNKNRAVSMYIVDISGRIVRDITNIPYTEQIHLEYGQKIMTVGKSGASKTYTIFHEKTKAVKGRTKPTKLEKLIADNRKKLKKYKNKNFRTWTEDALKDIAEARRLKHLQDLKDAQPNKIAKKPYKTPTIKKTHTYRQLQPNIRIYNKFQSYNHGIYTIPYQK